MYERPDALATLLAAIDLEVDPYQSARVARALRRVVVRDLDRRVTGELLRADQDMHNATSGGGESMSRSSSERLVVLADALEALRSDSRARCLAGCARIVARQFRAAAALLGAELAAGPRGEIRGWLALNLGAALEKGGDLGEAHDAYRLCSERVAHPSSAAAAIFALFDALRLADHTLARRDLAVVLDRDVSALEGALEGLRAHYAARFRRSKLDPLASIRGELLKLGHPGEYLESGLDTGCLMQTHRNLALHLLMSPGIEVVGQQVCPEPTTAPQSSLQALSPETGAGGVPTRVGPRRAQGRNG